MSVYKIKFLNIIQGDVGNIEGVNIMRIDTQEQKCLSFKEFNQRVQKGQFELVPLQIKITNAVCSNHGYHTESCRGIDEFNNPWFVDNSSIKLMNNLIKMGAIKFVNMTIAENTSNSKKISLRKEKDYSIRLLDKSSIAIQEVEIPVKQSERDWHNTWG